MTAKKPAGLMKCQRLSFSASTKLASLQIDFTEWNEIMIISSLVILDNRNRPQEEPNNSKPSMILAMRYLPILFYLMVRWMVEQPSSVGECWWRRVVLAWAKWVLNGSNFRGLAFFFYCYHLRTWIIVQTGILTELGPPGREDGNTAGKCFFGVP